MKPYLTFTAAVLSFVCPIYASNFTGPVYPLPNNNGPTSFAGYGSNVSGNGRTNTYAGLNLSSFSEVDWGVYAVSNVRQSTQSDQGQMTFGDYNAATGIATWNSTANWIWTDSFNVTRSYATRFTVQVQPYANGASTFLASGFTAQSSQSAAGISAISSTVAQITGDFDAELRFDALDNGNYTPVGDLYNSFGHNVPGQVFLTSSSAGFYYTSTPEPATWAFLASGLAALLFLAHRRQTA